MIAVTFAHPSESRDFLRLLGGRHREVKVLHTGVGAAACRDPIERFLDAERFDFLISSGFAGGVNPSLGVGTLFLSENFSDPALLERARTLLICRIGKLATADRVIEKVEERAAFAREHGADAVDMETEQIAHACAARKIPLLSLRAISDTAAAPFPAPAGLLFDLEQQRTRFRRLAPYLLGRPGAFVRLARFARQIAGARAELAVALKEVVENLVLTSR
jgi:adenosylhomocysteine nucleosidase